MTGRMPAWAAGLLVAAALAAMPSSPQAGELPGGASSLNETHGNWRVSCRTPEGEVRCVIAQNQVRGEQRQRVLAIELRSAQDGKAAEGTLVLPFGLKLDDGVKLAVDEAAPFATLRFSTCLPAGCLVPLTFGPATVAALRQGKAVKVMVAASDNGKAIALSIPLSGFSSALDRIAELGS
ncbi:MAG: invasion associated locus B family protein [Flavobacteriaceae bacterium]